MMSFKDKIAMWKNIENKTQSNATKSIEPASTSFKDKLAMWKNIENTAFQNKKIQSIPHNNIIKKEIIIVPSNDVVTGSIKKNSIIQPSIYATEKKKLIVESSDIAEKTESSIDAIENSTTVLIKKKKIKKKPIIGSSDIVEKTEPSIDATEKKELIGESSNNAPNVSIKKKKTKKKPIVGSSDDTANILIKKKIKKKLVAKLSDV